MAQLVHLANRSSAAATLSTWDSLGAWATERVEPTSTGIRAVFELEERLTSQRYQGWLKLVEDAAGERLISQRNFWRLHESLHRDIGPHNIALVTNFDATTMGWKRFVDDSRGRISANELVVSARVRSQILHSIVDILLASPDRGDDVDVAEVKLAKVRAVFREELHKHGRVRTVSANQFDTKEVPSTHRWVHSFMLWTGISPPVAVNTTPDARRKFTSTRCTGGHDVPDYRFDPGRYRGRGFYRRPFQSERTGYFQSRPSSARIAQSGRRECLRTHSITAERTLHCFGGRKMGDQFSDFARSRAL